MISQEQRAGIVDVSLFNSTSEVYDETVDRVSGLLQRHRSLIPTSAIKPIIYSEIALSLQQFGELVLAARGKTDVSQGPGMAVFTTIPGWERLKRRVQEGKVEPLEDAYKRQLTDNIFEMRFAEGVYVMAGGACQFFQIGSERWKQEGGAEKGFVMDYFEVVRVEGKNNEVWQNVDYNWDGSPKTSR